jgi:hypothetical protein
LDEKVAPWQSSGVRNASNASLWAAVFWRALAIWLPIAAATTGLAGIVYLTAQQSMRLGFDDPQIALARRTADRLNSGAAPASLVPEQAELATSLDPFVLVLDADGRLLASSVVLHGQMPNYPAGVFDTARRRGEDRVTWQPESGVREATVAVPWHGGFVVTGRSLELTERHVDQLAVLVGAGWLATLGLVAVAALLAVLLSPPPAWPAVSLGPWRIAAYEMVLGLASWMMNGLDEDGRSRALEALRATLAAHTTDSGARCDSSGWIITSRSRVG